MTTDVFTERWFGMGTEFDRPAPRLDVPGAVTSGRQPVLLLDDGLTRGDGVVGRFEASPALVAVKLAPVRAPVTVTLRLVADEDTSEWWERRVPESVLPRLPHGPRLLRVRSQGATRGAVVLARRPQDFQLRTRVRFTFQLTPDELPDDGMLIVELADVTRDLPESLAGTLAPHPAVGVRLDAVEVAPSTETPAVDGTIDGVAAERLGLVGTGGPPSGALLSVRDGFFTVPPTRSGVVTWQLRASMVRDAGPDPVPPQPGPAIPRRAPGEPPLSTRDKAIAVARHEADALRADVRRRGRHVAVRALRKATGPVHRTLTPRLHADLFDRGLIRARLVPLEDGPVVPCRVTAGSGGRVSVSCQAPPAGPAVVDLTHATADVSALARATGGRLCWHLVSVTHA
ncbi:MAG: hypothetical protein J2P24_03420 [Streptosporangiales bacterium]|nr:hypothetical protein [Streptosporangiales bacterium]MBO0891288.1 hypothetical protein [Acidothermales bacterium]